MVREQSSGLCRRETGEDGQRPSHLVLFHVLTNVLHGRRELEEHRQREVRRLGRATHDACSAPLATAPSSPCDGGALRCTGRQYCP